MKKRKLPLWAVLLWLLVWQAASMALDSDILLVSPLRVIATLLALLPTARFWASLLGSVARILGGFFLAAALGIGALAGIGNAESAGDAQRLAQLEEALRRSAVACYAAEGIYPPDLAYMEERYGLQIDTDRYTVYYDVFASNLMPDITVLENEP